MCNVPHVEFSQLCISNVPSSSRRLHEFLLSLRTLDNLAFTQEAEMANERRALLFFFSKSGPSTCDHYLSLCLSHYQKESSRIFCKSLRGYASLFSTCIISYTRAGWQNPVVVVILGSLLLSNRYLRRPLTSVETSNELRKKGKP